MGTSGNSNKNEKAIQNKLIVRYRHGTPIYIMPDLPNRLKEAVRHIKAGGRLTDLIKPINDGSGWGIHQESTWFQLIQEVISVFEQPSEGKVDREKAVLCVLETICSNEKDTEIWHAAKEEIFKYIDILSGWSHSYFRWSHQTEPVVKKEGKYYVYLHGQVCEIIGKRTEKEERWDYIADSCSPTYGAIHSLFKLIALVNICLDFQSNSRQYPASMIIVLPENGGASFLHWKWHIKWPYHPKLINWRLNNNLCDSDWLASDFLSCFSDQEGIPEKELEPAEWKGPEGKWREEFAKYPGQLEFAIDTHLRFGDVEEVWFDFRRKKLRWINQTENRHTILIIPASNRNNYNEEYELAMRFLSRLAFDTDIPINVITSVGCQARFYPMLHQPKRMSGIVYPSDYNNYIKHPESSSNKQDLAYAFYKEGLSSSSVYYSFLSFYKIIQLAFGENASKITNWINNNLDKIRYPGASERIKEIKNGKGNVVDYLFHSGRCAIAHVKNDPIVDPDNSEDRYRLSKDLPIVKGLARYAIESGIFNSSEKEIKS
jgi:hypothetical protein